jgi:pimeloyl-ACP methyl ester carboxylesterase
MVLVIGLALAGCGDDGTRTEGHATGSPSASLTTGAGSEEFDVTDVDVPYQEDPDGTERLLSVFAPAAEGGPWPVAVMIHGLGGGMAPSASQVAAQGVVVFVPTWEMPPIETAEAARVGAEGVYEQVACAVAFARAEAERYGGDPENLTLYGHSAGASIAIRVALSDPKPAEGCVAPADSVVPDNLVLFEGDWLVAAMGFWDRLLREDPGVMDSFTPWTHLDAGARIPIRILDSGDPTLVLPRNRTLEGEGDWLTLRDPTGAIRRGLERMGAFDDGKLSFRDVQRLLLRQLKAFGYEATFHDLPDSSHSSLSDEAVQVVVDAILRSA